MTWRSLLLKAVASVAVKPHLRQCAKFSRKDLPRLEVGGWPNELKSFYGEQRSNNADV